MSSTPLRIGLWTPLLFGLLGCVPLRGGWDVDALVRSQPSIVALRGNRLGDMTPFPALDGNQIVLVACRFRGDRPVRVRGQGSQWRADWGEAAIQALNRSVDAVELMLDRGAERSSPERPPDILITTIAAVDEPGPQGLGDTLSECDVSRTSEANSPHFGELVGADIHMRRDRLDMVKRVQEASPEEWIGALMHELGHALGFAGHAAAGQTILVRDETRLRAAGRRALSGAALHDTTLEALYSVQPGTRLGARRLKPESIDWLEAIRNFNRKRSVNGTRMTGPFARVGDLEARLVWRDSNGRQLVLRLPHWQEELGNGVSITLVPDRRTRALLAASSD